jgi:hypothetical protein
MEFRDRFSRSSSSSVGSNLRGSQTEGSSARVDEDLSEPAKRGDSIKPGVERSGTPGILEHEGKAQRVGDSHSLRANHGCPAVARFARSVCLCFVFLGFRFAGSKKGASTDSLQSLLNSMAHSTRARRG